MDNGHGNLHCRNGRRRKEKGKAGHEDCTPPEPERIWVWRIGSDEGCVSVISRRLELVWVFSWEWPKTQIGLVWWVYRSVWSGGYGGTISLRGCRWRSRQVAVIGLSLEDPTRTGWFIPTFASQRRRRGAPTHGGWLPMATPFK